MSGSIADRRTFLWYLAAFGQQGVETVLDVFHAEPSTVMALAGTRSLEEILAGRVVRAG